VVHNGELIDIIVDGCESPEEPATPEMERILALDAKKVQAVVVAKLDRLAR